MRALVICPLYPPNRSGSALHMSRIAEAMAADGIEVTVWTTDAVDTHYMVDRSKRHTRTRNEDTGTLRIVRFPLHGWPLKHFDSYKRIRDVKPPWTWWLFRDPATHTSMLNNALTGIHRFDLVVAGVLPHTPFLGAGAIVANKWHAPLVVFGLMHTGEPKRVEYLQEFLGHGVPNLLSRADKVICNTDAEVRVLEQRGIEPDRLVSIGPGVDEWDCLAGDAHRFRKQHAVYGSMILHMGTQTHEKGSHHTAESILNLRRRGMNVTGVFLGYVREDFELYLATKGPNDLEGLLVLGEVTDEVKRDALAATDILAMPSRADSFGIAFLEAWLNGKPCIGAFAGGIPYVIEDGVDGFLVPFGDAFGMSLYMETLIRNPDLAGTMGEWGREKVRKRFLWDIVLDRFRDEVYPLLPRCPGR